MTQDMKTGESTSAQLLMITYFIGNITRANKVYEDERYSAAQINSIINYDCFMTGSSFVGTTMDELTFMVFCSQNLQLFVISQN